MANAGDIDMVHAFFFLPVSKNATATITKGQIISLKDGRPWQAGDVGPFGVANQNVASGADMKGKIVINGVVWVAADSAIAQFAAVAPVDVDEVATAAVQTATSTYPAGSTAVTAATATPAITTTLAGTPPYILGMAFDAATNDGDLLRVFLDF